MIVPAVFRNAKPWSRAEMSALVNDGDLVAGQLQHHRPGRALDQRPAQHRRAHQRRDRAEQVAAGEGHRGVERLADEQHAGQEHVDRQPRRTAHERRDQDRGQAIAAIRDQPRRHDPRQRAGVARQQRHEGVAGQPEPAQQPIHHEGRPRQVAGVLEQADQEEQQADLRQEHRRAGDAADDAVGGQIADRPVRQRRVDPRAELREDRLDQVHRQLRQREQRPEHPAHDRGEDEDAEDRMGERLVEALRQRVAARADAGDAGGDRLVGPRLERRVGVEPRRRVRFAPLQDAGDDRRQAIDGLAATGDDRHDRTADLAGTAPPRRGSGRAAGRGRPC